MNLANRITAVRILLIPVFMALLLSNLTRYAWVGALVFAFAAVTDSVDGYLARKHGQVTLFGQFFDPLADKLLITAALISLVELGRLSAWIATLIITREIAVSGLRLLVLAEGELIPSTWLGKGKTAAQVVALSVWLLSPDPAANALAMSLMVVAVALTVISGVQYFMQSRPVLERITIKGS